MKGFMTPWSGHNCFTDSVQKTSPRVCGQILLSLHSHLRPAMKFRECPTHANLKLSQPCMCSGVLYSKLQLHTYLCKYYMCIYTLYLVYVNLDRNVVMLTPKLPTCTIDYWPATYVYCGYSIAQNLYILSKIPLRICGRISLFLSENSSYTLYTMKTACPTHANLKLDDSKAAWREYKLTSRHNFI